MGKNWITGTHHVAVKSADEAAYKKTMEFYRDILGLDLIRTWGEGKDAGAMLGTDNFKMEIYASGRTSDETGSIHHFAVATNDVDSCIEAAGNAGYEITVEPKDIVIGSEPPYPARIGFCIGPNGEEIEFFCEK